MERHRVMKEYNEQTVIRSLKALLDSSDNLMQGNGASLQGCLYYDTHNSLIDAIGLLGGDVTEYKYIDPSNPDREGRV
mgnify:CR=1 FL=1